MANAISSNGRSSFQPIQVPSLRPTIEIDLDNLEEYAGIKPDDIGIRQRLRNREIAAWKAEDILADPDSYPSYQNGFIDPNKTPPVQFTFKGAVKFVVDAINERAFQTGVAHLKEKPAPLTPVQKQLIDDLAHINTPQFDLMGDDIDTQQKFWFGTIICMLWKKGHIQSFRFFNSQVIFIRHTVIFILEVNPQ